MMIERSDGPAGHLYRRAGRADALSLPGATTIIDAELPEPAQLTNWRRRQDARAGIERMVRLVRDDPEGSYPLLATGLHADGVSPLDLGDLVGEALLAADASQAAARDAGTAAHEEIAAFLASVGSGGGFAPSSGARWHDAAAAVVDELDLESWDVEVLAIREPHYGGTIDLLGVDSAGGAHIVDWKTTGNDHLAPVRYREAVQIAAYSGLCVDAGGDLALVALEDVRGHVARVASDGRVCLCEVDVEGLWPHWVRLLDRYQATLDRGWFVRRTRRLG